MADDFITFEELELDDSFSFEEDRFINFTWQSMVVSRIAKRLGRSDKEVRERIRKLGVRKNHEDLPLYYNNFTLYYVKKYMNDFDSNISLAEFLGFDVRTVRNSIKILTSSDKYATADGYKKDMRNLRKLHEIRREEQNRCRVLFNKYYGGYPSSRFEGAIGVKCFRVHTWRKNYEHCFSDKVYKRALVLVREDIYPIVLNLLDCNRLDEVKALVDRETA